MIWELIITILMLASMIFVHELGHMFYLSRIIERKVKVRFKKGTIYIGKPKDYEGLTKAQYRGIYGSGILFGFFPSLFFIDFFKPFFFVLLLFVYLSGCTYDIKNFYKYGIRGDKWK